MGRRIIVPDGATVVKSREEYHQHVDAFFAGRYDNLMVLGEDRVGKSYPFQQRVEKNEAVLIKGVIAPIAFYQQLWFNRDKLVVIDNTDLFWSSPKGKILLSDLICRKKVNWKSSRMESFGIPTEFVTRSKVAMIFNSFRPRDSNAVLTKNCFVLFFDPPTKAVFV